jgi:hypothetical protein
VCYRCSKKGHPASACSVNPPINSDDKKSSRSSSKSSSRLGKIQKSFKAMGKALAQIGKGADSNNDSFGDQSHAQLVKDPWSVFLFATKSQSIRNQLLLDNHSSVHIMCNPEFVTNIQNADHTMQLKSNGGSLLINKIADFDGFETETWFLRDAMTNVLLFALVRAEYEISYEGEALIVHCVANDFSDMVFIPHKSGLHVYDPDDPRDLANYTFMETVESNMALFTKKQIHNAGLARNLQAGLAFPFNSDMKWALQSNLIKDSP